MQAMAISAILPPGALSVCGSAVGSRDPAHPEGLPCRCRADLADPQARTASRASPVPNVPAIAAEDDAGRAHAGGR